MKTKLFTDAVVAGALGWHIEHSIYGDQWYDGKKHMKRVDEWHPLTSDDDAGAALDAMLAKPEYQQVCFEMVNLVSAKGTDGWCVRLHFSPEKRLPYIERLGKTRAAAICAAIIAICQRVGAEAMYSTPADAHAALLAITRDAKWLLSEAGKYDDTWSVPQFLQDETAVRILRQRLANYEQEHGGLT